MLELLRAWLNGDKNYYSGIALYEKAGDNAALLAVFKKGPTSYTIKRLESVLMDICLKLKEKENEYSKNTKSTAKTVKAIKTTSRQPLPKAIEPANSKLYTAAKLEADKLYKEVMNNRAVLFAMVSTMDITEPNTEAKINERAKLAMDVVVGFNKASSLYEKADFVKSNGRLPGEENDEINEYDHLPDNLVKQTLDNLRKNYNKMKKRDPTAERVALLQKHEANIKKLSKRWDCLKLAT